MSVTAHSLIILAYTHCLYPRDLVLHARCSMRVTNTLLWIKQSHAHCLHVICWPYFALCGKSWVIAHTQPQSYWVSPTSLSPEFSAGQVCLNPEASWPSQQQTALQYKPGTVPTLLLSCSTCYWTWRKERVPGSLDCPRSHSHALHKNASFLLSVWLAQETVL